MADTDSTQNCPTPDLHGNPFRYCPNCSWMEPQPDRWERLAGVMRSAKREFDALPPGEQETVRRHLRQAADAGGFVLNFKGSEPA